MIHHTCTDCGRGFVATSYDEAREEYEEEERRVEGRPGVAMSFEELIKSGKAIYAKYCLYCGSRFLQPV